MTITAFIPFERKPPKGKASAICKAFGFTERAATSTMWVYGLGRFKVEVMDFRDDMLKSDRAEWVDEVGWQHKWAVGVSIHTQRREEQYIQWHVLTQALAWSYGVKEVWLDGATTIPQEAFNIEEFFEGISKSDDAEDKSPVEDMPELEQEIIPAPAPAPAEEYMPTQENPQLEPEPQPEPQPVEVAEEEDDDDDDDGWGDWDDWDDDDEESEPEPEPEVSHDELPQPVEVAEEEDDDDEKYQFDDDDEDEDDGLVDSITSW